MMTTSSTATPIFAVYGDGEPSDAAISALTRLLLAAVDKNQDDQFSNQEGNQNDHGNS